MFRENWQFLLYYFVSSVGIVVNCYTLYQLVSVYRSHPRRLTRLPFYQHVSIFGQQISTLPFVFQRYLSLCEGLTACYSYFGFMSIIITAIYTDVNRINLCDFNSSLSPFIGWLSQHWVIICLPLISVLPLIFNTYHMAEHPWCSWSASSDRSLIFWEVFTFYSWVWLVLAYVAIVNVRVVISLWSKPNDPLWQYYLWFLAFYSGIAYLSWLPRSIERFLQLLLEQDRFSSDDSHFLVFYPMYLANLICCWISLSQVMSIHRNTHEVSTDLPFSTVQYSLLDGEQSEERGGLSLSDEGPLDEGKGSDRSSIFSLRWSDYSFFSEGNVRQKERGSSLLLERHHPSFISSVRTSPVRRELFSTSRGFSSTSSDAEVNRSVP